MAATSVNGLLSGLFLLSMYATGPTNGHQQYNLCRQLQCPHYVVNTTNQVYQERQYGTQMWVGTTGDPNNIQRSRLQMLKKLVGYMTGANAENRVLNISLPFLTKVVRPLGAAITSNISMYFFLPRDAQNAPPAPTDPTVMLVASPVSGVYVRSFGGWTSRELVQRIRYGVMGAVRDPSLYDDSHFYLATYNGPFQSYNRYNELWVVKKDPPVV